MLGGIVHENFSKTPHSMPPSGFEASTATVIGAHNAFASSADESETPASFVIVEASTGSLEDAGVEDVEHAFVTAAGPTAHASAIRSNNFRSDRASRTRRFTRFLIRRE